MILFASDLHLSPQSPGATGLFLDFLAGPVRQAGELYLLGDLFEAWIGDDDLADTDNARIVAGLRAATEAGVRIGVLHGNRDFLLGPEFAQASGCQLLSEPYILSTPEWQFVLAHGDALCLDDLAYQQVRSQLRDPAWQQAFLARPREQRRQLAAQMRAQSIASQQAKDSPYSDLQAAATDDFLRDHGYATFIHGHTHQPATHDHIVDGIHVERWVLGDWHESHGDYLAWDGENLTRHRWPASQ